MLISFSLKELEIALLGDHTLDIRFTMRGVPWTVSEQSDVYTLDSKVTHIVVNPLTGVPPGNEYNIQIGKTESSVGVSQPRYLSICPEWEPQIVGSPHKSLGTLVRESPTELYVCPPRWESQTILFRLYTPDLYYFV